MDFPDHPTALARLATHRSRLEAIRLEALFANDPDRAQTFCAEGGGLTLDYSKSFCDEALLDAFETIAEHAGLPAQVHRLLDGEAVNVTEQRAALHTALRANGPTPYSRDVEQVRGRMRKLVERVHAGSVKGYDGQPISDVVNIGIGGSDLGPRMAVTALQDFWHDSLRCHFVANVDPCDLEDVLRGLDPARTLLIVASKSFTTLETLANARAARAWLQAAAGEANIGGQLVAITARPERAEQFGMHAEQILPMWDWVGGRFSLWSAIGLPIALAVGWEHFAALHRGAAAMDKHYAEAPTRSNLPMLLALLECWYLNFWDGHSCALLPYSHRLRLFPAFLQQLSMESLGKSARVDGKTVTWPTGAVIWGEPGTNGQHSFHQLLHQGTQFIPVEFIAVLESASDFKQQHRELFANCLSQSRALMLGRSESAAEAAMLEAGMEPDDAAVLAPHRRIPGNRPSITLVMERLDPKSLGALIALYEHKVHCQGVLWDINPFDQWGVELGKELNTALVSALDAGREGLFDASTEALMQRFRARGDD